MTIRLTTAIATSLVFLSGFASAETVGPGGEAATPSATITVSDADAEILRERGATAALLWHTSADFVNAVTDGATDEFERLGIEVVATTDAGFDAARQRSDIETALTLEPDIIIALPLDPVTSAEAFSEAAEAGVSLVFLSNLPSGYVHGEDYAAIVTDDLFQMGKQAADALAAAMGGEGQVAWIYHDADYYVTNQRDDAFMTTIINDYPNIEVVAEEGLADPARAEEIANALLLRYPDLDGIYVTWAQPAEGVIAALRANGNDHTRVVTLDLSEPVALDMAQGGNVAAIVANDLLGNAMPPFIVAPAITVTADNVAEGWNISLHRDAPESVLNAAQ